MNIITLTLIEEAYGTLCKTASFISYKKSEEIKYFIEHFFDIYKNIDKHGYEGSTDNAYDVLRYLKDKFGYTDNDIVIIEPKNIVEYY